MHNIRVLTDHRTYSRIRVAVAIGALWFCAIPASAQWLMESLHAFQRTGHPRSALIAGPDGWLWGTASREGYGSIFRVNQLGSYETRYSFRGADGERPTAGLHLFEGAFYGTTEFGGLYGKGTLFLFEPSTGFKLLHSFSGLDGQNPAATLVDHNGALYGTTNTGGAHAAGTLFRYVLGGGVQVLHSFSNKDGAMPQAGLTVHEGALWGITSRGGQWNQGTIFRFHSSEGFSSVQSFATGGEPASSLTSMGGALYGTTRKSYSGRGTIFRFQGGNLSTIHSFNTISEGMEPRAPLVEVNGVLYGTTSLGGVHGFGTVYRFDVSMGVLSAVSLEGWNGAYSLAGLVASGGKLYGTTDSGGANGHGAIFRYDDTGRVDLVHSYGLDAGSGPSGGLVAYDGAIYGTTRFGGNSDWGTVYRYRRASGMEPLHFFDGMNAPVADGGTPYGALLEVGGTIYGTTVYGGRWGAGTIFSFEGQSRLTTLHHFDPNADPFPMYPTAGLTFSGGVLFGLTQRSQSGGSVLYQFGADSGVVPLKTLPESRSPLIASGGSLYGTHIGPSGVGSIFRYLPDGELTTVHTFSGEGSSGYDPRSVIDIDGILYGVTSKGGAYGHGTIYRFEEGVGTTTLHSFHPDEGYYAEGGLVAYDGALFGVAAFGGPKSAGTMFRCELNGDCRTLFVFDTPTGRSPFTRLLAGDASLYGATASGGSGNGGVLFRLYQNAAPVLSTVGDRTIDEGVTIRFRATATDPEGHALSFHARGLPQGSRFTTAGDFSWTPGYHDEGSYLITVFVSDVHGASDSEAFTIHVRDAAPGYLLIPAGVEIDEGGNGIAEPGETVRIAPEWSVSAWVPGAISATSVLQNGSLQIRDGAASYAISSPGSLAYCAADCFEVSIPLVRPALHYDELVTELLSTDPSGSTPPHDWTVHIGESFLDVPSSEGGFYRYVETLLHNGITFGCGEASYCPDTSVTRAQMAVFLLRAKHGAGYVPPPASGRVFSDVSIATFGAPWIEQLWADGITSGCGSGQFCPDSTVSREQLAVFLLKTREGRSYSPPPATGVFADVPVGSPFARWIEQLANEGITAGCGGGNFCPEAVTTRGQMSVFLTKTLRLTLH